MARAPKYWQLLPENVRRLWLLFAGVLLLTLLPDLFIEQHEQFGLEGSFGFFAWYGFATCTVMVVVAKLLGFLLKRRDDYYDD